MAFPEEPDGREWFASSGWSLFTPEKVKATELSDSELVQVVAWANKAAIHQKFSDSTAAAFRGIQSRAKAVAETELQRREIERAAQVAGYSRKPPVAAEPDAARSGWDSSPEQKERGSAPAMPASMRLLDRLSRLPMPKASRDIVELALEDLREDLASPKLSPAERCRKVRRQVVMTVLSLVWDGFWRTVRAILTLGGVFRLIGF